MMRWVLLAGLVAMATATSPLAEVYEEGQIINDIGKDFAIFAANSSAEQTISFSLTKTTITIVKHAAAQSQAISINRPRPKIIVKDAAARGLVCVPRGKVEVSSAGKIVESVDSSSSTEGGGAVIEGAESYEGGVEGGVETHKSSEDLVVGQGGGVVASVSTAAASSGGGASASAAGGGGSSSAAAASGGGSSASAASGAGSGSDSSSTVSEGGITVDVSGGGEASGSSGGKTITLSGGGQLKYVDERFCECVPGYLCSDDGYINTSGSGIIDIRSFSDQSTSPKAFASKCKDSEACCKHRDHEQIGWLPASCGDRSPIRLDKRVVGGEASGLGKYPWMVAIIRSIPDYPDEYVCGGSLIGDNVVLTGAHCVDKLHGEHLIVRVGEWDTCNIDELYPHTDIDVVNIVQHEEFNAQTLANDVALLTLATAIEISPHVNTICLPDADHSININIHDCVATGWGKESFQNSKYSNILKEVPLSVVDHDSCQVALRTTRLGRWFKLHDTFTCAGGQPHVDTCKGDGGSPLVCRITTDYEDEEKFVQVGIVAWGIGCGQEGIPGVYVDVAKLLPWIQEHKPAEAYP